MTDDETQPVGGSGSRWEPTEPEVQAPAATEPAHQQPAVMPAYAPAPAPRNRSRLALASGAVGIAVVAGAGGFALGHTTADDGREGPGRFGGPPFGQSFRGGPGGQQLPPFGHNGPRTGPQTGPGGQDGDGFPNGQLPDDPRGDDSNDQPDVSPAPTT